MRASSCSTEPPICREAIMRASAFRAPPVCLVRLLVSGVIPPRVSVAGFARFCALLIYRNENLPARVSFFD